MNKDTIKCIGPEIAWNEFMRSGNPGQLAQVYKQYYDRLFTYGMKHTSDLPAVEDAIQDVFLSFVKFRNSISEVRSLSGYLFCSFRRQLYVNLNKVKRSNLPMQGEDQFGYYISDDSQDSENQENIDRVYTAVRECVSMLSSKQQEIIYLRFENEISYEEISMMLNITIESCYKTVYRTIKKLRQEAGKILNHDDIVMLKVWSKRAQ